jgi:hypothetical protein
VLPASFIIVKPTDIRICFIYIKTPAATSCNWVRLQSGWVELQPVATDKDQLLAVAVAVVEI